jgi:hypothetical protein
MRTPRTHCLIAALAVIAVYSPFVPALLADQSDQEATTILTTGCWYFKGTKPTHVLVFRLGGTTQGGRLEKNGTVTILAGWDGTWALANGTLTFSNGNEHYSFQLPIEPKGTHGTNAAGEQKVMIQESGSVGASTAARGGASNEVSAVTPTPPIDPQTQQSASALIQKYHDSLVFVTGSAGSGSGFIATMNGANFLITNVHVTAGIRDAAFKTLDGAVVRGDAASMAVGEDIFCMSLPAGGTPLEIMQGVDANAAIGDQVVVLGNAEGQGVINTIIGKIVGIGPNLVEIDAPFVPGNSGSPIIHLKTGKVIGVATYTVTNQYDLTTDQKLKQPIVRRFGYRIDSVKGWQPVNWRAFYSQAVEMENIETLTDDLYDFFRDLDENKGVVTPGRHTNPVIKTRIDDWLAEKGTHASPEDAAEANASFLSFLKIACQSDVSAAQRQITYDYFRRDLADQKETRNEMAKAFQEIIAGEGQ